MTHGKLHEQATQNNNTLLTCYALAADVQTPLEITVYTSSHAISLLTAHNTLPPPFLLLLTRYLTLDAIVPFQYNVRLTSTMSDLQLATAHGPTNTSPTQHTYSAQLSAVNTHSILIVGPAALHSQADLNIWKTNLLPVSLDRSIFTNSIHALMRLRNTQLYSATPGYNSSVTHFSFSFHDE